jgi:hypothetical protein
MLNGHCRDTAHADEVEPEFQVPGQVLKTRLADCRETGFFALSSYIPDERLIDIWRWSVFIRAAGGNV